MRTDPASKRKNVLLASASALTLARLCAPTGVLIASMIMASPGLADVIETRIEAAGVQQSTATFSTVGIETFDARGPAIFQPVTSTFNNSFGTFSSNIVGISASIQNLITESASVYGGAGGAGFYATNSGSGSVRVIDVQLNQSVNYFGIWISAMNASNTVALYRSGSLVYSFDLTNLLSIVGSNGPYYGNPNNRGASGEPFAFLNFFNTTGVIDEIRLSGAGFESDNWTVGNYLTLSGNALTGSLPNMTTASGNVFSSVNSSVTNVFDGGTLTNGSSSTSSDTFSITGAGGTIDAAGHQLTFAGVISNDAPGTPGKLTIASSAAGGIVVLAPTSGPNTFSGGLDVQAGATVQAASGNALGSGTVRLLGGVNNAATLKVTGTTTITNALVAQGGSVIDVASNTATAITGAISGGGALTLTGGGTTVLMSQTGTLGAIRVTGGSTAYFNTGSLNNSSHAEIVLLNASLAPLQLFSGSSLTIDAGSTLRGAGYVNAPTTIAGTLRPGNSPGTLVFGGSVTQAANSVLALDIDGPGVNAGAGNYSSVIVNGMGNTYTAHGTVQPILRGISLPANNTYSPQVGSLFTVVSATGGVFGSFTGITQPSSGMLTGTQFDSIYNANTFQLVVTPSDLSGVSGLTPNEKAVGAALQSVRPTPGVRKSAAQASVYDALYKLPLGGYAPAYDRMSFAIYGDALMAQGDAAGLMGSTVADQMAQRRGASLSADGSTQKYCLDGDKPAKDPNACRQLSVWGNAVGQIGRTSATSGDSGYKTDNRGLVLGADAEIENNTRVGAFAGYTTGVVNSPSTAAKADLTTWSAGVYGALDRKDMFVNALASFVNGDQKVTRNPLGTAVSGKPSATGALFSLELGTRYAMSDIVFEPNVGLRASNLHRDTTSETGASPLAATVSSDSVNTALASLGARSIWRTKLDNGTSVTAVGRVGYGRELGDQGTKVSGAFTALNTSATVASSARGRDAFLGGVSMTVSPSQGVDLFLRYDAELRSNASSQFGAAGLKMSW